MPHSYVSRYVILGNKVTALMANNSFFRRISMVSFYTKVNVDMTDELSFKIELLPADIATQKFFAMCQHMMVKLFRRVVDFRTFMTRSTIEVFVFWFMSSCMGMK